MNRKIRLARFTYCLASWLAPIKTPQRTYEWTGVPVERDGQPTWDNHGFEYAGVAWLPCRTSIRLIELSRRIDPQHWDHWALEHFPGNHCDGTQCSECDGHVHSVKISYLNGEVTHDDA